MATAIPLRLEKLRAVVIQNNCDALLVYCPENRRYLSGFTGSSGYLLITPTQALLATDFRYFEQMKREAPHFELLPLKNYGADWLVTAARRLGVKKIAFEAGYLPFSSYKQFVDAASVDSTEGIRLLPETGWVESLRSIKDESELASIRRAVSLTRAGLNDVLEWARPGMTEKEIAWHLEKFLRENGSGSMPFEIIVASGPNSALPHAHPGERQVMAGDPIVIDVGSRIDGYCSDITRTVCLGSADDTFQRVRDVVFAAQQVALATLKSGMTGSQADGLARTVIEQAGYGDRFGHGLGHGVGLEPHEEPRLGPSSADVLANSQVFTVEPGVYIPGWGGVRIEDTVLLAGGKAVVLT